jgi:hypothetical protein
MAQGGTPTRTATTATRTSTFSDEDAIPEEDATEVTKLFSERLRAWKHAVAYIEDYIEATEKLHKETSKDFSKVLKTVSHPLKEGQHFDQSLGGVAGMFDNIRSNTQGISNSHEETAKALKGSILPLFNRLHQEIKNKSKELAKGAGKGSKLVDKARKTTQKHIEVLGQQTTSFDSTGGKIEAQNDPYILQRQVYHRLNRQVIEENNNRQDLLSVQNSFASFEAHVLQSIQQGMGQFNTVVSKQAEITKAMYGDMVGTSQRIPLDFEWNGFLKRNIGVLIDPAAPTRSVKTITFPHQNHRATQPLIAGSLDRKSKLQMGRHKTSYYVVTPSKYLHEFSTDDDFAKDPTPDLSLFLPDCVVGAVQDEKFAIKGKDMSKNKIGIKGIKTHEYSFKAHTAVDAGKWWNVIRAAAGQVTQEPPGEGDESVPSSPVDTMKTGSGSSAATTTPTVTTTEQSSPTVQTPNITDVEKSMSPIEAKTGDGATAQDASATPATAPAAEHVQNVS